MSSSKNNSSKSNNGGHDDFKLSDFFGKFEIGTFGDDTIFGTPGNEKIFALSGDDQVFAAGGNDKAFGGRGNDLLVGDRGNDKLFGGDGNDGLSGGLGNDDLNGGAGRDFVVGGAGNDDLSGGAGNDRFVFRLGSGNDRIEHLDARDRIDLRDYGFASHQAARNAAKQAGHDVVLNLGNGNKIVIEDTNLSQLSAAQFITSNTETGPSSSQSPYVVPVDSNPATTKVDTNISLTSMLTTGDSVGGYQMAGIPDGLGAFDNGDGTFTILINHEFRPDVGAVHAHGSRGAFISKFVVDSTTLQVTQGSDLIQHVHQFNPATGTFFEATTAFNRLCSADLADQSAFYNASSGLGYNGGRIFLNGEETSPEGRAFAHIASGPETGHSYELAALGNLAFENIVANEHTGNRTVVAETDDGTNGQVYFYFGDKQTTGNAVQQAGLTNGLLYGLHVDELATNNNNEVNTTDLGADRQSTFSLVNLGNVTGMTGAQLDTNSEFAGVTSFLRPEDGAWDTINPNRFYFVTTNEFAGNSKLWAVDFNNAADPNAGGTIRLLLDGSEGQRMMDNLTVNGQGHVIIQEDVGNNPHLGRIWDYDPFVDTMTMIAQHDPDRFDPAAPVGGPPFLTQDEESSGIVDMSDILGSAGQNVYLLDVQAHYPNGPTLVEGGQLLLMHQDLI